MITEDTWEYPLIGLSPVRSSMMDASGESMHERGEFMLKR
jgi:hypothetical protein